MDWSAIFEFLHDAGLVTIATIMCVTFVLIFIFIKYLVAGSSSEGD
jgi:hypothetical protein